MSDMTEMMEVSLDSLPNLGLMLLTVLLMSACM